MIRQPHTAQREIIVADAIRDLVSELRLVDSNDYVAFIRMEQFGSLSDIVQSAAELYFMPGTLRLGHGAEAHAGWTELPRVVLDLELRPPGVTIYFALSLEAQGAAVEVTYVAFEKPDADPGRNTAFMEMALERSRIRRTQSIGGR